VLEPDDHLLTDGLLGTGGDLGESPAVEKA